MGREVRMVPADWQHPKEYNAYRAKEIYRPMLQQPFDDAYDQWLNVDMPEWIEGRNKWSEGLVTDYCGGWKPAETDKYPLWEDYAGTCPASPDPKDHMPDWSDVERTHFMMYEDTSGGTPISPAFDSPEKLARWLADTGASSFGDSTATYDQWLSTIKRGWAMSAVIEGGVLRSGVEAIGDD